MKTISIDIGNHKWEKTNLVSIKSGQGYHDSYTCKCGLRGKSYQLGRITIPGNFSNQKIYNCPNHIEQKPKISKIQIKQCHAFGPEFSNLAPGSIHDTIAPPEPFKNDIQGVWVMGVSEPVKVLNSEFKIIS